MKKLFLFGIFLLATTVIWAQNVPRQMVVLEITTSTLCTYCPGAAMGAEDLLNNGKFVAVIEHHNSWQGNDPFDTPASNARSNTLAPGGNPGAFFDVKLNFIGGSHTQSMYANYLPKYNARIATPSPLTMTMDVTNTGLSYTAVVNMVKVGGITSTNLRMMFVVTQSHIPFNWEGQTVLNYVNRLMLPDANGTVISFSASDTVAKTINFSLDASWPHENCEIIAFVEDMTGKEVLNGMKRGVVDLQPEFTTSDTSVILNQPVTFTNTTTGGYIDTPETYLWLFPGATPNTSTLENPVVTYNQTGSHDVTLTVNRGGQIKTLTKSQYITVNGGTAFTIDGTITYPNASSSPLSGITLTLKNALGAVIGTTSTNSTGNYSFSGLFNGEYTLEATTTKAWGGATASDILLYKKHVGNIALLEGIFLTSGDVNGSGGITASDVLLIKKRIGNITNSFVVGDWAFNNTPITVSGSNVTQNFNGLCYGDANASYIPVEKYSPATGHIKSMAGSVTIGSLTSITAGQITIPVHAAQINNMGSFQFSIEYDPTLMTFAGTSNWFTGITAVSVGEPTPGYLTFVWAADAAGISIPDNTFFNLDFTWNGNGSTSSLSWGDNPTAREFGDWDGNIFVPSYTNGSVAGAPVSIGNKESQTIKVYPNPASEFVDLKSDYNIQGFEVISYLGQVVNSRQGVESKFVRIDVSSLQSGVYFVNVNTDQGKKVIKITVTH